MDKKIVKELHCKMCPEKFCGQNCLLEALMHLKERHQGIFSKDTKKNSPEKSEADDLCSPVVTSTHTLPDVPCTVSTSTQTDDCDANNEARKSLNGDTTVFPVPGDMKSYFSLTDSPSIEPYTCKLCLVKLINLKMCVVHLLREHKIPLKRNPQGCSGIDDEVIRNLVKRQSARKSANSHKLNENAKPRTSEKKSTEVGIATTSEDSGKLESSRSRRKKLKARRDNVRRKRIVERKVASLRHVRVAKEVPLSPEDCFEPVTSCSEPDSPGPSCSSSFRGEVPLMNSAAVTSSSIVREPPGEADSTQGPMRQEPRSSLWKDVEWNSVRDLGSDKVTSSGLPSSKRKLSLDSNSSKPDAPRKKVLPVSAPDGVPAQRSLSMLKRFEAVNDCFESSDEAATSSSSDHRPVAKSTSLPACSSSAGSVIERRKSNTARKTTRPAKSMKYLKHQSSESVVSFLSSEENKKLFSKDLQINQPSPPSGQEIPETANENTDFTCTQDYCLPTPLYSNPPKKLTGRKSARNKYQY